MFWKNWQRPRAISRNPVSVMSVQMKRGCCSCSSRIALWQQSFWPSSLTLPNDRWNEWLPGWKKKDCFSVMAPARTAIGKWQKRLHDSSYPLSTLCKLKNIKNDKYRSGFNYYFLSKSRRSLNMGTCFLASYAKSWKIADKTFWCFVIAHWPATGVFINLRFANATMKIRGQTAALEKNRDHSRKSENSIVGENNFQAD